MRKLVGVGALCALCMGAVFSTLPARRYVVGMLLSPYEFTNVSLDGMHREGEDNHLGDETDLLVWNIHRNYAEEGLSQRLAEIIASHDIDTALLQEVPLYSDGAFWDRPGITPLFGSQNVFYAPRSEGHFGFVSEGQATLSAHRFTATDAWVISDDGQGLWRAGNYVRQEFPDGDLLGIYNVHMEYAAWPSHRVQQMQEILLHAAARSDDVTIIAGDFNTALFGMNEPMIGLLEENGYRQVGTGHRYGGVGPTLDYVFVKGEIDAECGALPHGASDHDPIVCSFRRP